MDPRTAEALVQIPDLLRDLASKQETANLLALSKLEADKGNKTQALEALQRARARLGAGREEASVSALDML